MSVKDLDKKVQNEGATPEGVLTADEYNILLSAVQEHEEEIETLNAGPEVMGSVSQQVRDKVNDYTRDFITRSEVKDSYALKADVEKKQDELISGSNIKTINGQSILGGGNIDISSGSGSGADVVAVSLDISTWAAGKTFKMTPAQLETIRMARSGAPVTIVDSNNYYNGEWGQVISCYRQYLGSSIYSLRLSILHKDNAPMATNDRAMIYNIDITDYMVSGAYDCTVTSINNLY